MPIYEFRCDGCSTLTEKICRSDVREIDCPRCGQTARRAVSVFAPGAGSSDAAAPTCRPSSGLT